LRRVRGLERKHGAEEDGTGENVGTEEEHGGGDVGAVGVADGDHLAEVPACTLVFHEIGQLVGAANQIVLVENAGGDATEKTGLAILKDLSARTEQCGAGPEEAAERDQIVFVATGAVKEEEGGGGAGVEEEVHSLQCSVIGEFNSETTVAGDGDATGLKTVN
jgi:hypothetical protein